MGGASPVSGGTGATVASEAASVEAGAAVVFAGFFVSVGFFLEFTRFADTSISGPAEAVRLARGLGRVLVESDVPTAS